MNSIRHHTKKLIATISLLVTCGSLLVACGGSSGGSDTTAGIGGTGIVAGKITGFGSIYVNGGKFDINTSQFNVDGDTDASQDDLALGMVIALEVETENGVYTGKALKVVYDDEVEGPIAPVPGIVVDADPTQKTFEVFGQTINIDDTSTLFDGTSFETIAANDIVEISGFRVSATEINASYVEKTGVLVPDVSEVELRGIIDQYMGGSSFEVDGTVINFDPTGMATEIDVQGGIISNGLYVEVEGVIQVDQSVDADKIEEEDEDFDDDIDDISLQGVVSGFAVGGITNFFIDSQRVNASMAQFSPPGLMLVDNLNIEVEGEIVSGTLIADEVEARDGETKLRSEISEVVDTINDQFIKVIFPVVIPNTVTVRIDGQTLFEDETGAFVTPPFSLDDLMPMDYVRIEGQEILNNEVLATVIKRRNSENKLELEGEVDDYEPGNSITILGIEYGLDLNTDYEPSPPSIAVGDFVELEDDDDPNPPNGIADEVEEEEE